MKTKSFTNFERFAILYPSNAITHRYQTPSGATTMEKLLNKYAADRSDTNAMALVKHDKKHPFAAMFLTQDQADMLAQAKRVVAFNSRYA